MANKYARGADGQDLLRNTADFIQRRNKKLKAEQAALTNSEILRPYGFDDTFFQLAEAFGVIVQEVRFQADQAIRILFKGVPVRGIISHATQPLTFSAFDEEEPRSSGENNRNLYLAYCALTRKNPHFKPNIEKLLDLNGFDAAFSEAVLAWGLVVDSVEFRDHETMHINFIATSVGGVASPNPHSVGFPGFDVDTPRLTETNNERLRRVHGVLLTENPHLADYKGPQKVAAGRRPIVT